MDYEMCWFKSPGKLVREVKIPGKTGISGRFLNLRLQSLSL